MTRPMGGEGNSSAGSREIVLFPGETLIHEGELGDTAYCILDGEVKVWKHSTAGPVELALLRTGAIFGEMSLVDEKPRSASITAVQETRLKEVKRDQFLDSFQHDPDFATSLLRVLFERLRETGAKLTQHQTNNPASEALESAPVARAHQSAAAATRQPCDQLGLEITIEGLTDLAARALPNNPQSIDHLPFRIGRVSDDKLAYNDLTLPDLEPYQLSVNHLLFFLQHQPDKNATQVGVFDRGSSLGSWLNGIPLGGLMANDNTTYLSAGTSELVLGDQESLFRFRVTVTAVPRSAEAHRGEYAGQ